MKISIRQFNGNTDWEWIRERVNLVPVHDTCGMVAFDEDNGGLLGAIIFDNFLYSSAQISIVVDNPMVLRRGLFESAFEFLAVRAKRKYAYSYVNSENSKALRMQKKLGFKEVYRIKEGYKKGVDFVVSELNLDDFYYVDRCVKKNEAA